MGITLALATKTRAATEAVVAMDRPQTGGLGAARQRAIVQQRVASGALERQRTVIKSPGPFFAHSAWDANSGPLRTTSDSFHRRLWFSSTRPLRRWIFPPRQSGTSQRPLPRDCVRCCNQCRQVPRHRKRHPKCSLFVRVRRRRHPSGHVFISSRTSSPSLDRDFHR